ncbi:MAG: hypothetical protein FWF81_12000 [Defluviitaleaceae bacterium]|nr:hypothetical protein [Defluviitaleaceae bacterium]
MTRIIELARQPKENINSDVPGKYCDTYFRIEGNGYDVRNPWSEKTKTAYDNEVRKIFTTHGWIISESEISGAAARATKGRSNLYLHPQNFSGVCENAEREKLFEAFKNAATFRCSKVDVYEEIHDMSDAQLIALMESKKEIIETELLEEFTTKRRNLYITDVGLFGVNGNVAKRHSVKRLAIDGKKSYGGQDECSVGICLTFVSGIFQQLVYSGKIVTAQTKDGLGYRTAKKGERAKKAS